MVISMSCPTAIEEPAMPSIALPVELTKSFWDKKKGALDGAGLDDTLKALQKKHDAVDWPKLADGWSKAAGKDAAKLKALHEALDKLYRTKASPLKLEATALASAADKAAKAKDADKPRKDACTLIAKEALAYAKAVGAGLDALELELGAALKALPKESESDEGEGEDGEPANALLDPDRLLKQLKLCKADPARQVFFAYLDNNKDDPYLAVHHKTNGRSMTAKISKDVGIKTGAYGLLSLDGMQLKLVVEKKYGGLVKRIRIPIRKCGFKIGKVMLVSETGETLDQDDEDTAAVPETAGTSGKPAPTPVPGTIKPGALPFLQQWAKVRGDAVTTLKGVAKEIADLKDPESAKAVIEISAVVKNLTVEPTSPQQIAELVRYIDKDDVVLDVSEFASDIRTPLLKVLAQLHKAVQA